MVTGRLSRAMVVARRGMVATGHPLASAAGLRILTAGGNAVDAAVAIAGVLGVAQPMMSGLGADTFMLVYRASERKLYAVNGSGVAPYAATAGWFAKHGHRTMPLRGMLAVSVPGAVDAMVTALERWGSGRFTLGQLLDAAIAGCHRAGNAEHHGRILAGAAALGDGGRRAPDGRGEEAGVRRPAGVSGRSPVHRQPAGHPALQGLCRAPAGRHRSPARAG